MGVEAAGLVRKPSGGGDMAFADLAVFAPEGRSLLDLRQLELKRGEAVWLSGASGLGKTTLLKTVAGIWPYATGRIDTPDAEPLFLPQQSYFPPGELADVVAYPREADVFPLAARAP